MHDVHSRSPSKLGQGGHVSPSASTEIGAHLANRESRQRSRGRRKRNRTDRDHRFDRSSNTSNNSNSNSLNRVEVVEQSEESTAKILNTVSDSVSDSEHASNHDSESNEDQEGPREFRFSLEDDTNLQGLVEQQSRSPSVDHHQPQQQQEDISSEYILAKLYNYMKISEMSKYGINVFDTTFSSYLPFLSEADLFRLASSYWCNGAHFNVMTAHRGHRIKPSPHSAASSAALTTTTSTGFMASVSSNLTSMFGDDGRVARGSVLTLEITDELLDAAMQSGASVDKIEAMLLQKRRDEGTQRERGRRSGLSQKRKRFYQTKRERAFYLRNLKHRFWNHEVLVRVFVHNHWMTADLAAYAMKTFVKTIYHRVLQSKAVRTSQLRMDEPFLRAFFADHFGRDHVPWLLEAAGGGGGGQIRTQCHHLSEETLRRWCQLIELLASRGAAAGNEFERMIPLRYAQRIGQNTFQFISSSHKAKNKLLCHLEDTTVPDDIWDVLVSYL